MLETDGRNLVTADRIRGDHGSYEAPLVSGAGYIAETDAVLPDPTEHFVWDSVLPNAPLWYDSLLRMAKRQVNPFRSSAAPRAVAFRTIIVEVHHATLEYRQPVTIFDLCGRVLLKISYEICLDRYFLEL
jgi:hypothetical protein